MKNAMTKPRAAALLGGLTLVAILLLSNLGTAKQGGFFDHKYLQTVKKVCKTLATDPAGPQDPRLSTGCQAIADLLDNLKGDDSHQNFAVTIVKHILPKYYKPAAGPNKCDTCIQAVSDLEAAMSANHVMGIFTVACTVEFQDPARQSECISSVSPLPEFIDDLVASLPPLTVCQIAGACSGQ